MAGEIIERLIFALDGDASPYRAKLAGIEAETAATAAKINGVTSKFFSETPAGTAKLMAMRQAIQGLGKETETAGHSVATATREFRALFDELSSGRTRQTPGTLAIIATRVFGISGATLAWGAALAAIPAAMVAAATASENAVQRVQRALQSTGGASGQTMGGAIALADILNRNTSLSSRGAMDTLAILNSRGNIPSGMQGAVASTVPGFASATGTSWDEAAKKLEQILADPAKGAAELHDSFKLLSAAQMVAITDMTRRGELERAQAELIRLVSERFSGLEKQSSSLMWAWDGLTKWASNAFSSLGQFVLNIGPASSDQRLQYLNDVSNGIGMRKTPLTSTENQERIRLQMMKDYNAVATQQTAKQAELNSQLNETLLRGLPVAETYDKVGTEARKLSQDAELLKASLSAVNKLLEATPKDQGLLDARAAITSGLTNVRKEIAKSADNKFNGIPFVDPSQIPVRPLQDDIPREGPRRDFLAEIRARADETRKAAYEAGQDWSKNFQIVSETKLSLDEQIKARQMIPDLAEQELAVTRAILQTNGEISQADKDQIRAKVAALQVVEYQEQKNQELASGFGQAIGSAMDAGALGGGKLSDIFKQLETDIARVIMRVAILIPMEKELSNAMSGSGGLSGIASSIFSSIFGGGGGSSATSPAYTGHGFSTFAMGGAWTRGVRFAAQGMVLGGPTMFGTANGPVVGGEMGPDSEALLPLARGPGGKLGVQVTGGQKSQTFNITQVLNIHPDVSAVARTQVRQMMPELAAQAVAAVRQASLRS